MVFSNIKKILKTRPLQKAQSWPKKQYTLLEANSETSLQRKKTTNYKFRNSLSATMTSRASSVLNKKNKSF